MRIVRENMGFHQRPQSATPTPSSNQILLSGEVITLQDCKQVKVILELLERYQEVVDYDKREIVQTRGLNNHRCNFQSSCKLERFKVKIVNPVTTSYILPENIRKNMGFHRCHDQSTIPTSSSNQISLSRKLVTLQDHKQQEAEKIREKLVFENLNQILFRVLELEDTQHKGLLIRKIFTEIRKEGTHDLEKLIFERLGDSYQVKVILELLQSCQEVDYDNIQESVQIRGLNNHLTEGRNFRSPCKLDRFKVKIVTKK
ncbi:hypothetical protein OSB04_013665 [Centaurea solstitialis]|uniref:Uncharacterized protein n=1 Tax=Centaurea solstitialis TaxID=347529 RepID=A0AA38TRN0_9ASTR|nr:hypothetical protein OSB04_013665 [Centaurea solstitialis]